MGIIKTQSIINSIITYIGIALGFITTIYLYPRILQPDQYGLTRLLISISFVFSQFAHLGIKNIPIRYFPFFEDKEKGHNGLLFFVMVIPLIGFALFTILYVLLDSAIIQFFDSSPSLFIDYYWYVIPLVFFVLYYSVLDSYTRALGSSIPGSLVNEILIRVAGIILLLVYSFGAISFKTFIIIFVCSYGLLPLILIINLIVVDEFHLKPSFSFISKKLIKDISSYGLYALLGGISVILVSNIDVIMLGSLTDLTSVAIYTVAFYVGSVIVIPQKSINKIAPTLIAKFLKEENYTEINRIYKNSSLTQLTIGFLILIGIVANLDNLFRILPDTYSSGKWTMIIIGVSKLIDMAAGVNGTIILNSKYYRFDLYTIFLLIIISVGLNYIFIPLFGVSGAAFATLLSLSIYNLIKGIFVWRKFSMQPLSSKIFGLLVISLMVLFLSTFIPYLSSIYVDIIIRSTFISICYTGLIFYFKVSDEINNLVLEITARAKQLIVK